MLDDGSVHRGTGGTDAWERVGTLAATSVYRLVAGDSPAAGLWAVTSDGVFRTLDAGATWSRIGVAFDARAVVPDPGAADVPYAASRGGVLRSIGGGPWVPFGTGLDGIDVRSLALERSPKALIAGTIGRGAFRLTIAPCGDGVVDADETPMAEIRCVLPDPAALSACIGDRKGAARVRRRLVRLLHGVERVVDHATVNARRAPVLVRRARRLLRRLTRVADRAGKAGLLAQDCPALDGGLERSLSLLAAGPR